MIATCERCNKEKHVREIETDADITEIRCEECISGNEPNPRPVWCLNVDADAPGKLGCVTLQTSPEKITRKNCASCRFAKHHKPNRSTRPARINLREKKSLAKIIGVLANNTTIEDFCEEVDISWQEFIRYINFEEFPSFPQMLRILNVCGIAQQNQREAILHLYYLHTNVMAGGSSDTDLYNIKTNLPAVVHANALVWFESYRNVI